VLRREIAMPGAERTQPGLLLGIGHIRTKTHDYVRHGALSLFAALNYLRLAGSNGPAARSCRQLGRT
jgi:hypothetical protein